MMVASHPPAPLTQVARLFPAQRRGSSLAHLLKGTSLKSNDHIYTASMKTHFKLCLRHDKVTITFSEPLVSKQPLQHELRDNWKAGQEFIAPGSSLTLGFTVPLTAQPHPLTFERSQQREPVPDALAIGARLKITEINSGE